MALALYSFGDTAIFMFCRSGLKLPIHAHFVEEFWGIFPQIIMATHRPNPKRHFLKLKHVVWAIKRESRSNGSHLLVMGNMGPNV